MVALRNAEMPGLLLGVGTIKNMQHPEGYFSYQLNRFIRSEVPYMRWAQAWMFYAFSIYINHEKEVCE